MTEWVGADEAQGLLDAAAPGPWTVSKWNSFEVANKDVVLATVHGEFGLPNADLMAAAPRLAATVLHLSEELSATWEMIELVVAKLDPETTRVMLEAIDRVKAEVRSDAD